MEFEVKEAGTWKKQITVKVPRTEIAEKKKEILREFRTTVAVPGFRLGHTPDDVLTRRFKEDIDKRLKSEVISKSAGEAVEKSKVRAVTLPEMKHEEVTVAPDQDLEFSFTVEVRPEFDLPEYKGLSVAAPSEEVTEQDVEHGIEMMRHRLAEFRPVEEPAGPSDVIVGDSSITSEGRIIREQKEMPVGMPPAGSEEKRLIGLAELPVKPEDLAGIRAGETRSVEFTFPADYRDEDLRGKPGKLEYKALEVRRRFLPEVNDELAKRAGMENLEALKNAVKDSMRAEKKEAAERAIRRSLMDKLIEATKFDLPPDLLKSEQERQRTRAILQLSRMGMAAEAIKQEADSIKDETAKRAERDLRQLFILSAISEKEKIEVEEAEVEERIDAIARYWNTTPVAARNRLAESGGISAIYEDILQEKVLDFLRANANVVKTSGEKKA